MADEKLVELLRQGAEVWNPYVDKRRRAEPGWRANLRSAELRAAFLAHTNLTDADLTRAILKEANLKRANFERANLRDANLRDTDLTDASFTRANLRQADLTHADLTRAKLIFTDLTLANLKDAKLREAYLTNAVLRDAYIMFADLKFAKLEGADLTAAKLEGTDFTAAKLEGVDLTRADLKGANLKRASLTNSNLRDAYLGDANLTGARLGRASISNVYLSRTNGLASVRHDHPSSLATDTLVRSRGKIPDIFLRGCGLTDWEIANARLYAPDLTLSQINDVIYEVFELKSKGPIQVSPVFLSYTHADSEFVDKLYDRLQTDGVRCWLDRHEMTSGPIEDQIDRAMQLHPVVILVLSKNSVNSDWVELEASKARKLEKQLEQVRAEAEEDPNATRPVLCPIALDDAWRDNRWSGTIQQQMEKYYIMPFHQLSFEDGYARLKKGLGLHYPRLGE